MSALGRDDGLPGPPRPRALDFVAAGYSAAAVGLLVAMALNGTSGAPIIEVLLAAALIAFGLSLAAAGTNLLRRATGSAAKRTRKGLAIQAAGLVGLMAGTLMLSTLSSLSPLYALAAVLIAASGVAAVTGAVLVGNRQRAPWLVLGTSFLFAGVLITFGASFAAYFFLSDVGSAVVTDVGETLTAIGCVLAAYWFFVLPCAPGRTSP